MSAVADEVLLGDRPALERGLRVALDDLDGHVEQVHVTGLVVDLDLLADGRDVGRHGDGVAATDDLRAQGGSAAKLLDAYKAKYGGDPASSYALYGVAAVQVILAAVEKSDGTRKSVTEQVFSGEGITIPADVSAIGKEIKIDPKTGDVNLLDMTIEVIKGNQETTLKGWPVTS